MHTEAIINVFFNCPPDLLTQCISKLRVFFLYIFERLLYHQHIRNYSLYGMFCNKNYFLYFHNGIRLLETISHILSITCRY